MNDILDAKILIVDDEPINLELMEELLSINEFKNMVSVDSAKKAYQELESQHFDLIVLDLMMPEIGGLEVCQTIRRNHKYDHIAIIIATAVLDLDVMETAFEAGVDDYVRKPIINDVELVLRIQKALKSR